MAKKLILTILLIVMMFTMTVSFASAFFTNLRQPVRIGGNFGSSSANIINLRAGTYYQPSYTYSSYNNYNSNVRIGGNTALYQKYYHLRAGTIATQGRTYW